MNEDVDLLRRICDELKEIRYWTKLSSLPILRRVIQENLRDDESKLVYELSDGNRSTREIALELVRMRRAITHVTVANMWRRWAALGLVEPSERYQGRFRRIVSLESLGIEIPRILERDREGDEHE